jgi:UDP-glucuronate 4-epimerase
VGPPLRPVARHPVRGVAVFLGLGFLRNKQKCQRPDLALEAFTRRIAAGQPLVINGDGSQRRDLTHVSDVARAVELALRWPGPGSVVLNVGTGRNHSVLDMAKAAAKTATPRVEYQVAHPADVPETLASITAVGAQLGWQPRIIFPDGPIS